MKKHFFFLTFIFMLTSASISYGESVNSYSPINQDFLNYIELQKANILPVITKDGFTLGEIPSPHLPNFDAFFSIPRSQAAKTDPVYDLRTAGSGGSSLLTSVKNQGQCGACWTFATMGSIEGGWKKAGMSDYDLSENNLKECNGFLWGSCSGGNLDMAASYMARKSGPVSESEDIYSDSSQSCKTGLSEVAYVTDVRYLPSDMSTIKQALIDNGAIYTNMYWSDSSYNSSNKTYYYSGSSTQNHAVLLVGWDDNKSTAGGQGAWIIKNSWGTSWGENGFFYISYNDTKVNSQVGYFTNRTDYNSNARLYSYDDLGNTSSTGYGSNIGYGLVKFISSGKGSLTKVGTWVHASNATIDISIYDTFSSGTLSSLLGSISNQSCTLPGYYTFNLSSSINIENGNDFYIKVKYNTPSYNYPIPLETAVSGYANPTIESGKCWISSNGISWTQIGSGTNNNDDTCIKAYQILDTETTTSTTTTSSSTSSTSTSTSSSTTATTSSVNSTTTTIETTTTRETTSTSSSTTTTSTTTTTSVQPQYTLTLTKAGTGTGTVTSNPSGINCGSDCSEPYSSGTQVTLTATADSWSTFTGWSGACSGTGLCVVTMDSKKDVTSNFKNKLLIYDFNGNGRSDILWRNKTTGQLFMWMMNGTTKESDGSPGTVEDLNWEIMNNGDFNGDGRSDILWRNKTTGQVSIWVMNGTTKDSEGFPGTIEDLNWKIKGVGDFNGDGKSDILWRNKTTGQVSIWIMNGTAKDSEGSPGTVDDLNWEINDTGDFNGDWKSDILWRNKTTGQVYIWIMNGLTLDSSGSPGTVDDLNWEIKYTGDFNGNAKSDVLWRNKTTGQTYIWFMNGLNRDSEGMSGTVDDLNWETMNTGDYNGDGKSDILWRNKTTGQTYIWIMNGLTRESSDSPGTVDNLDWEIMTKPIDTTEIKAISDFNGNGKTDILWRNKTSGQIYIWLMNGMSKDSQNSPGTVEDLNWETKGMGDFNGNSKSDILWRNKTTGQTYMWLMNGTTKDSDGSPGAVDDLNWEIMGIGDFNGNGKTDILWRNKSTGQVYIWLMNGLNKDSVETPGTVEDLTWEIKGVGDFNGNGKSDILWRNKNSGMTYIWFMNGTVKESDGSPGSVEDTNWEIIDAGDFNGDGKSDILWRNKTTGQTYIWLMNGITISSKDSPGTVEDLNWEIINAGDFNGNGKSDILWRNKSTGQVYMWLMNGIARDSEGMVDTVGDLNWEIKKANGQP